jgi:hypothetical protein
VFTARYALSPYIKQICFVFKGLILRQEEDGRCGSNGFWKFNYLNLCFYILCLLTAMERLVHVELFNYSIRKWLTTQILFAYAALHPLSTQAIDLGVFTYTRRTILISVAVCEAIFACTSSSLLQNNQLIIREVMGNWFLCRSFTLWTVFEERTHTRTHIYIYIYIYIHGVVESLSSEACIYCIVI